MRSLTRFLIKNSVLLLLSIILAASLAGSIYILFLQHPVLVANKEIAVALALWLLLAIGLLIVFVKIIRPVWRSTPLKVKILVFCGSLLLGLFSLLQINGFKQLYFTVLLPQHTLDILASATHETASLGNRVEIGTFNYGRGEVNLQQFSAEDGWSYRDGKWIFSGDKAAHLRWKGSILDKASLLMFTGPLSGNVLITWDGQPFNYTLYSALAGEQLFTASAPIEPFNNLLAEGLVLFACCGLFGLFFGLYLSILHNKTGLQKDLNKSFRLPGWLSLLFLALPMLLVWGLYQAVYFPAVMTPDSIAQWQQVLSGQYNDWNPFIHTLIIRAAYNMAPTPAAYILVQILFFSLVIAWGLNELVKRGLPFGFGLLFSLVFAIWPVNGIYAVTIWKDVPYAIMILCLVIQLFNIVASRGAWLERGINQLGLALCAFSIMLLRHNGIPIPIVCILVLLLIFRSQWRALVNSLVIAVLLYFSFTGPVYDLFKVEKNSGDLGNTIILHHIGAHVQAGTPLSSEDRQFLDDMMPLQSWKYDCCGVNSLYFTADLNKKIYRENSARLQEVFVHTLLDDPLVDFNHLLCASSIVYSTHSSCYNYPSGLILQSGQVHWIEDRNLVPENSLLPQLVGPLSSYVTTSSSESWFYFFWRPALSLGIALLILFLILITSQSLKWAILGLPLVLQSGIMLLINLAQDFRYHYSIGLVLPFLLAVLVWQIYLHLRPAMNIIQEP
ncbi:MAG: DUF6020 family protein [Anaerolineae bacterium]|nr:DUF6020 family protein [Anaerolineae bacterium]